MDKCRVCGSDKLEQYLDLGDQAYCNSFPKTNGKLDKKYPLRIWFCHNCTGSQLDYIIPKEDMFAGDYLYVSGTTKTLQESFQQAADKLVSRLNIAAGDLVVDIGSNDGTWLKCYLLRSIKYRAGNKLETVRNDFKCRVLGVEPSNVAEIAQKDGIETLNTFFNLSTARDILRDYGPVKLVTAAGVFLHLEELHSVVEGIKELIGDAGTFYLQTMYVGDMIKNTAFDGIYHEHLNYWTLRALHHLFERYGLQINDAGHLPIHGGSLELFVSKKGKQPIEPDPFLEILEKEEAAGLYNFGTYKKFADSVWIIGTKLSEILHDYKDCNKLVYAFGAPAKGATLLNTFGIDGEFIPAAVEKNQLKVGRYIAGTDIPILDDNGNMHADAYFVLPWNFLPEFLIKNLSYIMGGGEFIVPIPEPVVITKDNIGKYLEKRR